MENIVEPKLEKLLEELLQSPGFDKGDILYSRRFRKQVREIVDRIRHTVVAGSDEDSNDDGDDDIAVLRNWLSRLAKCEKRLMAYEREVGTCWHSLCYPYGPDEIYKRRDVLEQLEWILAPVLKTIKQEEVYDVGDVVNLLGPEGILVDRSGDPLSVPEACRGKYVFVCCVNALVLFHLQAFQSLLNLCNELSSERDDVQLVMVAKMNILADTREVFDHLFSAFPKPCLAVPYENWEQREHIGRLLSFGADLLPHCVVFNTNGWFFKSFCANDYKSFPYGAEAFPFTKKKVQEVRKKRVQLRTDRLENLLRPYEWSRPDDVVVYDFEKRPRPISEVVKNKHVGLYVCCDGRLIPRLLDLCEHCKSKELEFEIVMLNLPFLSGIDPDTFAEMRAGFLALFKVRGWWRLPFNNSVSLRFCDLTKDYHIGEFHCHEDREDKLIIVGPDGKILDMYGAQVIIRHYGFDAHPFSRAAVVKKKMMQMRNVKLDSLVAGELFFQGINPTHVISARTLLRSKKEIIIYLGNLNGVKYDFSRLVSQYKEMKRNGVEFEVVFIDFYHHYVETARRANEFVAMPWYICCPHTNVVEKLRKLIDVESLVGFGEDGRICSVKSLHIARLCLEESLFDDLYHNFNFHQYRDI